MTALMLLSRAGLQCLCLIVAASIAGLVQAQTYADSIGQDSDYDAACTILLRGQQNQNVVEDAAINCVGSRDVHIHVAPILKPFIPDFTGKHEQHHCRLCSCALQQRPCCC